MIPLLLFVSVVDECEVLAEGPAMFGVGAGVLHNTAALEFPVLRAGIAREALLRRGPAADPLAVLPLRNSLQVHPGSIMNFPEHSLRMEVSGAPFRLEPLLCPPPCPDLTSMLAAHPGATPQQVWDAAFMAGVEMTTTLLGGTRE